MDGTRPPMLGCGPNGSKLGCYQGHIATGREKVSQYNCEQSFHLNRWWRVAALVGTLEGRLAGVQLGKQWWAGCSFGLWWL